MMWVRTGWKALLSALVFSAGSAWAQDFPVKPIRLVVPFGAGTTTDIVARVMAEGMGRVLGQAVVIENRAGAGGGIGSDLVAKAPADGYTLVMGTVGTHAINATLYKKLAYDPQRDFAPVAFTGYTPTLLVVPGSSSLKSLRDLAEQARRTDGRLSFASAGNGTSGHLAGDLLKSRLGGEMTHVPYKDGALALSDVMSGQVQFMFYHPAAALPHIKSGKLRALGVSSAKRSAAAPEVPAIAESGFDFDLVAWFMVYAPAATPAPVLARLRDAAAQTLANPEVAGKLKAQGLELSAMRADEMSAFGRAELAKWAELVRRSGAQVD
ncbi:MAG: Bug family tripartite tricarboxylate transporter substrate binding protein [Betaproteobacteria bacterium]